MQDYFYVVYVLLSMDYQIKNQEKQMKIINYCINVIFRFITNIFCCVIGITIQQYQPVYIMPLIINFYIFKEISVKIYVRSHLILLQNIIGVDFRFTKEVYVNFGPLIIQLL